MIAQLQCGQELFAIASLPATPVFQRVAGAPESSPW